MGFVQVENAVNSKFHVNHHYRCEAVKVNEAVGKRI